MLWHHIQVERLKIEADARRLTEERRECALPTIVENHRDDNDRCREKETKTMLESRRLTFLLQLLLITVSSFFETVLLPSWLRFFLFLALFRFFD